MGKKRVPTVDTRSSRHGRKGFRSPPSLVLVTCHMTNKYVPEDGLIECDAV